MHKGEGVLHAAERFLRYVDNAQDDAGNESGDPGVLSIFFDPLLLVNIFIAQVEYALKKDYLQGEPVLQTSAAAFVAAFHSVTGQTRRDTFGSLRLVIAMLNRQPSIYQNTQGYSPKTPKIPSQAAYNAAGKGASKGKAKVKAAKAMAENPLERGTLHLLTHQISRIWDNNNSEISLWAAFANILMTILLQRFFKKLNRQRVRVLTARGSVGSLARQVCQTPFRRKYIWTFERNYLMSLIKPLVNCADDLSMILLFKVLPLLKDL